MGLGCWAIGGPFSSGAGCRYETGQALGWGTVDDEESIRAIRCALDLGITFFDTADAYGTGHSERVLGKALAGSRDRAVIATKFGNTFDPRNRELTGTDLSPSYIRRACEASLRRLGTNYIDLYQLHVGDLPAAQALEVADCLERLRDAGLIRFYGWRTDDPAAARTFAAGSKAAAIQHDLNIIDDAPDMLSVCTDFGLVSINRSPLAMGFLTGKFTTRSRLAPDDIRSTPPSWLKYFQIGGAAAAEWTDVLSGIKDTLTTEGRSLAQGALAWIWARGSRTLPIPGFRTEAQVRENAAAMSLPPLSTEQIRAIDRMLHRSS
jgi:aryl-alcohol dehydrogenase-like predicted oxidoreductase